MAGEFTTILILVATGAAATIALIFLADARDWRRMRERMRHQRALAEMEAHPASLKGEPGTENHRGRDGASGSRLCLVAHHDGLGR